MREIKFRAWDTERNAMAQVNYLGLNDYELGMEDEECKCWNAPYPYVCKLMQYTGLKDKNGKEICEGDIIETCDNKKQLVIWHNNGFKLKFTYSRTYQGEPYTETTYLELGDTSSRRWGDEVIGNIYENPELLES